MKCYSGNMGDMHQGPILFIEQGGKREVSTNRAHIIMKFEQTHNSIISILCT